MVWCQESNLRSTCALSTSTFLKTNKISYPSITPVGQRLLHKMALRHKEHPEEIRAEQDVLAGASHQNMFTKH